MMNLDTRLARAGFPDEPPGLLHDWKGPRPSLFLMALRVSLGGGFPSWVSQLDLDVEVRVRTDVGLLIDSYSRSGDDLCPGAEVGAPR